MSYRSHQAGTLPFRGRDTSDERMDLSLYRASSGVYIVVPDCMQPSIEAEHLHGPLDFQGLYHIPDAMAACARLTPEMEAHCFAVLSPSEAARLLASSTQAARRPA